MKKIYIFFAWCAFFVVLTIATIFGDRGLMGELGRGLAMLNLSLFGYLGYVYLLFFIYPAYAVYKDSSLSPKRLKVIGGILLICAGILVVQFALFGSERGGKAGELLVRQISPFVGVLGVIIATFLSFLVGILLLMPDKIFWLKDNLGAIFEFLGKGFLSVGKSIFALLGEGLRTIWSALSSFFQSDSIKAFNPPIKENSAQNTQRNAYNADSNHTQQHAQNVYSDSRQDFRGLGQDSKQNLQNHLEPFWEQSIYENPNKPHRTELDFDERQVTIIYEDKDKEQKAQESKEQKYAKMVRLVEEGEEGEVLEIDASEVLERAKKREAQSQVYNEPLQPRYTRLAPTSENQSENKYGENHENNYAENHRIDKEAQEYLAQNALQDCMQDSTQEYWQDLSTDELASQNLNYQEKNEVTLESTQDFAKQDFDDKQGFDSSQAQSNLAQSSTQDSHQKQQNPQKDSAHYESNPFKHTPSKTFSASDTLLKELDKGTLEKPKNYALPDISFLAIPPKNTQSPEEDTIDKKIHDLEHKLKTFKINGNVEQFYLGPVVTTFEFVPEANVKVSRIEALRKDISMALSAKAIRIQAPIPGKNAVGIEVPNSHRETIYLREVLDSELFKNTASPLALGLGKDLVGNPFVTDLKKLPHLLVAGTTGSGKSVGVNAMILSLLYRNSPQSLRLIMIDPKRVEFSLYEDIPHLLTPIITDPAKAITALNNLTREMERRYDLMREYKTKTIDDYNVKARQNGGEIFPFIVVIIDELADLMMTGGKEAEMPIIRVAQMGRASGLHLIVATQRPSREVVTGLIKTNFPARLAFRVGQSIDSRVILDNDGAQNLLGNGDMLFSMGGVGLLRLHAPWATPEEIESIVSFICSQGEPEYDTSFLSEVDDGVGAHTSEVDESEDYGVEDELLQKAKNIMLQDGKTSISHLQTRGLGGYPKCRKIVLQLEKDGFLSKADSKGVRHIIGG